MSPPRIELITRHAKRRLPAPCSCTGVIRYAKVEAKVSEAIGLADSCSVLNLSIS